MGREQKSYMHNIISVSPGLTTMTEASHPTALAASPEESGADVDAAHSACSTSRFDMMDYSERRRMPGAGGLADRRTGGPTGEYKVFLQLLPALNWSPNVTCSNHAGHTTSNRSRYNIYSIRFQ